MTKRVSLVLTWSEFESEYDFWRWGAAWDRLLLSNAKLVWSSPFSPRPAPKGNLLKFRVHFDFLFLLNLDYRLKHSNLSQVMSVSLSEPLLSHCVFDLSLFFRASFSLPKASTWPVLAEGSVYRLNDSKFNFRSLMSSQTELSLALIDFEFGF